MFIVILAGGSGTRFWPLSRKKSPKQLMSVFGGKSMLQRTVQRILPLQPERILVVTNEQQAKETARQLQEFHQVPIDIIEEPVGRNTAPAIGLAAAIIASHAPDGVMVVLPADHFIVDEQAFRETISAGIEEAHKGALVTLGITPTKPETGYGYIEAKKGTGGSGAAPVLRFVEKPDRIKAQEFLLSGNFYWNSGMFIWRASVISTQITRFMPELAGQLAKLNYSEVPWELAELKPQITAIYGDVPAESIDFGVMERADNVLVIPANIGWSDVGSWSALPEVVADDDRGNVVINAKDIVTIDATDCLVYGDDRLVALVGVQGITVVNTPDALLVCATDRAQDVKKIVEELDKRKMSDYL
jgi:mannose-1-phosphate guanylyltransferase